MILVRPRGWSRWRTLAIPAFAGVAVLLLAACHRPGEPDPVAITIDHEVTPSPSRVGIATIVLRLTDASGKVVTGAQVGLEGHMSHPGMRPVFAKATETEPGRYQAPLELTMAGDWVVLVQLVLPDGQKLERQFAINGVRAD